MANYIGIVSKDPDSAYGVHFPDFPGCISAGDTLEELKAMAVEGLSGHIVCMMDDGEAIPAPSDLDTVLLDPDHQEGLPILVRITDDDLERARREMIVITDENRAYWQAKLDEDPEVQDSIGDAQRSVGVR